MIGDEVMFVVDTVVAAARIGLGLAEAYADDELLSDVRVGLAVGPVLVQDGDYYGPSVNLANRIVNIANPGTVLVSDEFHTELMAEAPDEFTGQALRPRVLRTWAGCSCGGAVGPGQEPDGAGTEADRRRNVRWERLAEVLRDLDELREVGERILTGGRRGLPSDRPVGPAGVRSVAGEPDGGDPGPVARRRRRTARAGGPAGRPASPSGPPMRTVAGSADGLNTRTSSTPGLPAHRRHLGPVDLEGAAPGGRASRRRASCTTSRGRDVVGHRPGVDRAERHGVAGLDRPAHQLQAVDRGERPGRERPVGHARAATASRSTAAG